MSAVAASPSISTLMDASGSLNRQIPDISTSNGIVAVVSSPDTPSFLGEDATSEEELLVWNDDSQCLNCRGATLSATSAPERTSLGTTSLIANAVVIDGITEGDVEMDLRSSRHARTLTALMRARLAASKDESLENNKQTLILGVLGPVDEAVESVLTDEVTSLFEAAAAEASEDVDFDDLYDIVVVSVQSQADGSEVSFGVCRRDCTFDHES